MALRNPQERATRTGNMVLWAASIVLGWVTYATLGITAGVATITIVAALAGLRTIESFLLFIFVSVAGLISGGISGGVAGVFQGAVVRKLVRLPVWAGLTAAGWGLGWAIVWIISEGIPSLGLRGIHYGMVGYDGTGASAGAVSWTLVGLAVGFCQYGALRRRVGKVGWWIPFTAVSWCAGAILSWVVGALLGAGMSMYWSVGELLQDPAHLAPGAISSLAGWIATGVLSSVGLMMMLQQQEARRR